MIEVWFGVTKERRPNTLTHVVQVPDKRRAAWEVFRMSGSLVGAALDTKDSDSDTGEG